MTKPVKKAIIYGVGIAALTVMTGIVCCKWRGYKIKQKYPELYKSLTDFSTNLKSNAYLHCYSWIRYYVPLLINNIAIISILSFYKNSKYYGSSIANRPQFHRKRYFKNNRHRKISKNNAFIKIGPFSCNSWQFFLNDIVLITAGLNVLFCIFLDTFCNSDPFHPLMLFEKYIEYKFINKYKKSVNKIINQYINNNMDNEWLLDIIWEFITYDTKKSHMIIDVKFTNSQLKHQSFICRKYKSMLSSQFSQYQQDMKFVYSMNKDIVEIKPNFEYFWKIRSFGFDLNVFMRDYLTTFKPKDSQQITQFILWCIVNIGTIYIFNKIFSNHRHSLLWEYGTIIIARESIFSAALIRITSMKWLYGGFFIIPHWYFRKNIDKQQYRKKITKFTPKKVENNKTAHKRTPHDWFWYPPSSNS